MWRKLRSYDGGVAAILAAAGLSFAVWVLMLLLGFHEPPANAPESYQAYFQQANWWPFPFFFLGLAPALWLTWEPMLRAWSRLAETGVLTGAEGKPDEDSIRQVLEAIRRKRAGAILAALAISLFINLADWLPRYSVLTGTAGLDQQLDYACTYPSASVKWIFDVQVSAGEVLCPPSTQPSHGVAGDQHGPPSTQILYNAILLAQQILIVFFAALAITQLLLHTFLFGTFERLAVARSRGLSLSLNGGSPLNEFGLEHWNYALNNIYWAVSPALLGVFLSRAATPLEDYAAGQAMLGIAVPVCLIAPMVATIIVRQARLPEAWTRVSPDGPVTPEDYRRQQLWPLDRNWSSKLGILLAFALAAMSIGFEVSNLVRL